MDYPDRFESVDDNTQCPGCLGGDCTETWWAGAPWYFKSLSLKRTKDGVCWVDADPCPNDETAHPRRFINLATVRSWTPLDQ